MVDEGQTGNYAAFQERALDPTLTQNERIGFSESCRAGLERLIADDIFDKLQLSHERNLTVLDIGCGCGALAGEIVSRTHSQGHRLAIVDSPEMLAALDNAGHAERIPGRFPDCAAEVRQRLGRVDRIVVYSVLQYVFCDGDAWAFVEAAVSLLDDRGRLLIGDLPNASMRKRLLSSASGRAYHRAHFDADNDPDIRLDQIDGNEIDDGFVFGILIRMRMAGLHAFIVPQPAGLPMANRREDLLIVKP